ncbi:MAG: TRAP transporter fused permease subunit [Alphaproteobacteria bacterium]|nr:TRAP transporter fused permease subunit [Alphaproteobacteria bacterium]
MPALGVTGATAALARVLLPILGGLLALAVIAFDGQLPSYLGTAIHLERLIALALAVSVALPFLTHDYRGRSRSSGPPLLDMALALLAFSAGSYLVVRYPEIASNSFANREEAFTVGVILLPLIIEALRRTAGLGLTFIVMAFIAYGLIGHLVPGDLQGRSQPFVRLVAYLTIDPNALFGAPLRIIVTVVITFIFLGALLGRSGGSQWFTDLAMAIAGRSRGGSAKIAVVASALFGTISGSAVANVVATGVVTIPMMRRAGYSKASAGAFEAVASTGGQIMPPVMGAAAFLMAQFLSVPYADVMIAALLPAMLYYLAIFIQADLEAAARRIAAIPADQIRPVGRVFVEGWHFLVPFAVLLVAIFELNKEPETAALWACATLIVLSFVLPYRGQRLDIGGLVRSVWETGTAAPDIVVIGAMAGLIIGVIEVTGLGFGLTLVLVQIGESSLLLLLLLTAVVALVLGMGMPTTAVYFLVATLAAPPLIRLGVEPTAAHMFVFYYGILSMITPPVAIAAFAAANLAEAKPIDTAVLACRYGWPAFLVPFLFVLSPELLFQGDTADVVLTMVTACAGVWFASIGAAGFWRRALPAGFRALLLLSGVALLIPHTAFSGATWLNLGAGLVGAALLWREHTLSQRPVRVS